MNKDWMSGSLWSIRRWLTVNYTPHPDERSFLERAQTRRQGKVEITVAVPSDLESERAFGVRLARHRMQAVWLEVDNGDGEELWVGPGRSDPRSSTAPEG